MMASSSAFAMLILALVSLQLSGCVAFAPPASPGASSSSSRWHSPASDGITAPEHVHLSRSSRGDTALSMGIRSFIKRKVLRKKDGEGEGADNADVTLRSILQSAGSAGPMVEDEDRYGGQTDGTAPKKRAKAGKNDPAQESRANPNKDAEIYEATQDRIRRMKGGGMTEEEKTAFLNNALRGPMQKPKSRGPPIRQKVPGMDDDSDISSRSGGGSKTGKESLWNAITNKGATTDISVASLMMDGKMKSEEAKRRYMESITNPDRFATFSTYQRPASRVEKGEEVKEESDDEDDGKGAPEIERAAGLEEEGSETKDANVGLGDETDFRLMKRQIAEDRELLNPNKDSQEKSAARDAVESILSMISSNADKNADPSAAAGTAPPTNSTTLGARLEKAAEVQEKRDAEARATAERKRDDERRAWAAAQTQRAEELRRKEAERMERAREAAEKERRREEERVAKERAELEARQARQDEYWAKKLKKERPQTSRSDPVEVKGKKENLARDTEEKSERDEMKEVVREKIPNEERAREDPVHDIEIQSVARASRIVPAPSNDDNSVSSFVQEQRKKNEEIERLRQLDRQSLKSLNSPLPSPGRAPVSMPPSPVVQAPRSSQRPSPDLSLASLTMAKKREDPSSTSKSVYPSPSPPSQRLNLFDMTKLKQGPDSTPSTSSSTTSRLNANQRPAKRAVRQQLPLSTRSFISDDEDDDDDDDLMRSGAPGLTVADALKQQRKEKGGNAAGAKESESADEKAKKWGIDMSKFK